MHAHTIDVMYIIFYFIQIFNIILQHSIHNDKWCDILSKDNIKPLTLLLLLKKTYK